MYSLLVHAHSGLRWIVLALLLAAIINALVKWTGKKTYTAQDQKLNLFTMTSIHIQFIIGLILVFLSPKVQFSAESMSNAVTRFFTAEHTVMMIAALVLVTIGYGKAKRGETDEKKFKVSFYLFFLAGVIIFTAIPWPWREVAGSWF